MIQSMISPRDKLKGIWTQIVLFGIGGILITLVHLSLAYTLTLYAHFHYLLSNMLAFAVAVVFGYAWHRRFTFKFQGPLLLSFIRFLLTALSGFFILEFLLYLSIQILKMPYLWGQMVSMAFVPVFTFLLNKRWTFGGSEGTVPK